MTGRLGGYVLWKKWEWRSKLLQILVEDRLTQRDVEQYLRSRALVAGVGGGRLA